MDWIAIAVGVGVILLMVWNYERKLDRHARQVGASDTTFELWLLMTELHDDNQILWQVLHDNLDTDTIQSEIERVSMEQLYAQSENGKEEPE